MLPKNGVHIADTLVICRPSQWREAAVVISCFALDQQPPLLVLEPPPCSDAAYRRLHERYRTMRDLRDEDLGTPAAQAAWKQAVMNGEKPRWSNDEIDRRVAALSPYRRWVKRHRLLAAAYRSLPLRRALLLFEATGDDLSVIDPQPMAELRAEREPLLGEAIECVPLRAGADAPLWQCAWSLLRPGQALPGSLLDVDDDPVSVVAGLRRARLLGLPLRIDGNAPASACIHVPAAAATPKQAVLVEAVPRAAILAAVFEAERVDAPMWVIAPPSTIAIERARKAVEAWYETPHATGETPPLDTLRAAVTRALPASVAEAVGDLPLTAWTEGVPYSLLRTATLDWSRKPIGLMTGDALLLAAAAWFDAGPPKRTPSNPDVPGQRPRLHALFDPGDFDTGETAGVMHALAADPGQVLQLHGRAASNAALIALSNVPVALLYFNTHGSDQAILLKDMPLPAYKLMQRVTLRSRPILFNNSCLSWTGVGREFLVAGARAYVGTLWSVAAQQAATFAIAALTRVVRDGRSVAHGLADGAADEVDDATRLAYVLAGPVSTRMPPVDAQAGSERAGLAANALCLASIGRSLFSQAPESLVSAEARALLEQAEAVVAELDRRWPQPDAVTLPLLTSVMDLATQFGFAEPRHARHAADLGLRGLALLGAPENASRWTLATQAAFWLATSRVSRKLERWADVLTLLDFSIQRQEAAAVSVAAEYLDRSDAHAALGQPDLAVADALRARAAFAASAARGDAQASRGAMLAAGRLAGLLRRARRWDAALQAMKDGHAQAVASQDFAEQSTFKQDESALHREQGNALQAIEAAREGLATARLSRQEALEVRALGMLTLALQAGNEWTQAGTAAAQGLEVARRLAQPKSQVAFLCDLAAVARASGDTASAFLRLDEAAAIVVRTADAASARRLLNDADAVLTSERSWAAQRGALRVVAAVVFALPADDRSSACSETMRRLLWRVAINGWSASRDALWRARRDLECLRKSQPARFAPQAQFVLDVVTACHVRSRGDDQEAQSIAAHLDEISTGAFGLTAFVASGDASDHPAWQQAREARAAVTS